MLDEHLFIFRGDGRGDRSPVPWTYGDAFQGTQILGGTGSGKSSTSGKRIALALLRARRNDPAGRFGGLVLTAKDDELPIWARVGSEQPQGYLALAGRSQADCVAFGPRQDLYRELALGQPTAAPAFNFLAYERDLYRKLRFPATPNLVSTLLTAMGGGQERAASMDPYWDEAVRQLLTNAIDLLDIADEPLSLENVNEVILTAPQAPSDLQASRWRDSYCALLLRKAAGREDLDRSRRADLCATIKFWAQEFPQLADRTRSVVVSSFTSKANGLLRAPFREMFSGTTTVTPEDTHRGRVLILDLPIKTYGETGRLAQVIVKTVWQKATEWRSIASAANPVFLWADEAQYFVTWHDVAFQQTARANRAATVYLTQNLPNYYTALGGADGRSRTDSLLGCLQTKVFHANSDVVTNEWAERLFGYVTTYERSFTESQRNRDAPQTHGSSSGLQPARTARVAADEFATLTPAGPRQAAQAFVFVLGKDWGRPGALAWLETFSREPERERGVFPA